MSNIARNLIKNSPMRRKWTVLSNYTTTPSYVNPLADMLTQKIEADYKKNAGTPNSSNVLDGVNNFVEKVEKQPENMSAKAAIQLMHTFYEKHTKNRNLSYKDLKRSNEFLNICKIIQKGARALPPYDIIYALRILVSLNVPTYTVLVQTLLQLIRVSVNDLSIGQIMTLYYTLDNVQKCPLVISLRIALCKVFREQAKFELCSESYNLFTALRFSDIINDTKTKQLIIGALLKNNSAIDIRSPLDIFYMLYTRPTLDVSSRTMLSKVKNEIIENATSLDVNQIHQLLYYVSMKFRKLEFDFYSEKMINVLCDVLLSKSTSLSTEISILQELNKMKFSSTLFLDKLAQTCIDSGKLQICSHIQINDIIQGFVIADYRPDCWAVLKTIIEDTVNNRNYLPENGAYFAFRLLSLDCYCPRLLEKVFTLYNEVSNDLIMKDVAAIMLTLHCCVKLFYPEYNGITVDENKVQQVLTDKLSIERGRNCCPSVMESLVEAVGGAEYIKYGLRTRSGKFVDYVVVLQPNGTPMNISHCDSTIFVEDLEPVSNCTKIPIIVFNKSAYSVNRRNISSNLKLQLKAMEMISGLRPFIINSYLWDNLSRTEKVLHLRNTIKPIKNNT